MSPRGLTVAYAGLRSIYALALLSAPGRAAGPWLGRAADSDGGAIAVRGLAARDLLISLGVLASARGARSSRTWLLACAVSDVADLGATVLARPGALPPRAKLGTIILAGGSAAGAVALMVRGSHEGRGADGRP